MKNKRQNDTWKRKPSFSVPSPKQRELALETSTIPREKLPIYTPKRNDHFKPLSRILPGDWLDEYPENGQTFREYVQSGFNPSKNTDRNTIYLLCLDQIDHNYPIDITVLVQWIRAYYHPMKVQLIKIRNPDVINKCKSRMDNGMKQLFLPDIFKILKKIMPDDSYCLLAVTMIDLYPFEDWNFAFGQASIKDRYGAFSFARYHPFFYGQQVSEDTARSTILRRSCQVCAHELGHLFGLEHCIYYDCAMNGSNSIEESDRQPCHLCPICLRKLQFNVGFSELARYEKLHLFYSQHQNSFPEEGQWTQKRIDAIKDQKA